MISKLTKIKLFKEYINLLNKINEQTPDFKPIPANKVTFYFIKNEELGIYSVVEKITNRLLAALIINSVPQDLITAYEIEVKISNQENNGSDVGE